MSKDDIRKLHIHINHRDSFKGYYDDGHEYHGCDYIAANFPYKNGLYLDLEQSNLRLLNDNGCMTSIAPAFPLIDPMSDIKQKAKADRARNAELKSHLAKSYLVAIEAAMYLFRLENFDGDFYINHYFKTPVTPPKIGYGPTVDNIIGKLKVLYTSDKTLSNLIKEQEKIIGDNTPSYGVPLIDWYQYARPIDYIICGEICYPVVKSKRTIRFDTPEECINFIHAYNHPLMRAILSISNWNRHVLFTKAPLIANDFKNPVDVTQSLKRLGFTDDEINFLYQLANDDYKRTYIDYAIDYKDGVCIVNHLPGNTEAPTAAQIDDCRNGIDCPDLLPHDSTNNKQVGGANIFSAGSDIITGPLSFLPHNIVKIDADNKSPILWLWDVKSCVPFTGACDNCVPQINKMLADGDSIGREARNYYRKNYYAILRYARWHISQQWSAIRIKRDVLTPAFMHLVSNIWRGPPIH